MSSSEKGLLYGLTTTKITAPPAETMYLFQKVVAVEPMVCNSFAIELLYQVMKPISVTPPPSEAPQADLTAFLQNLELQASVGAKVGGYLKIWLRFLSLQKQK